MRPSLDCVAGLPPQQHFSRTGSLILNLTTPQQLLYDFSRFTPLTMNLFGKEQTSSAVTPGSLGRTTALMDVRFLYFL